MLAARYLRFLPIFVTFAPMFAIADSTLQINRVQNGIETYVAISLNAADLANASETMAKMQKFLSGDYSGLKPANELPPPVEKSFVLPDTRAQDLIIILNLAAKVALVENAPQSAVNVKVYSTENFDARSLQVQQDARGLALQIIQKNPSCAMTLAQGFVMSVQGNCALVTIEIPAGGRVKVYQNGKFSMKSQAARLSMDEVKSQFQNGSSSEGLKLLEEYLRQDSSTLTEANMKELLLNLSSPSQKTELLKKMAPRLQQVSAETLLAILSDLSSPSYQVDAIRALRGKVHISSKDLVRVLNELSSPSYQTEALRELAPATVYHRDDLPDIVRQFSSPSYETGALKIVEPQYGPDSISGREVINILEEVSAPSYQMDVLRILISKVQAQDRASLNEWVLDNLPGSYAKDASKLILQAR
jgi:hypothetical protein